MAEEWGNHLVLYLYDADGSPIGMQYRNTSYAEGVFDTYWFEKNLQGDIVAVYNQAGTKLIAYTYDAWGNSSVSYYNSGASTTATYNPFRYRGYYFDSESGFYYLNSRYYDPAIGRFINPDDVSLLGANGDFASLNLYAYCGNNPVARADNGGTAWETVFDLISLASSIIEVSCNPVDIGAWVGLVGDIIDVAVPFVAGVGETVRLVNTGRKVTNSLDDMNDARKVVGKIHGNSLSSNKINYGYQLIDKNNNIVKYGESKNPLTRYSSKWLDEHGYRVQIKVAGTKRGVHEWQHDMIENYALISGARPPRNKSLW